MVSSPTYFSNVHLSFSAEDNGDEIICVASLFLMSDLVSGTLFCVGLRTSLGVSL